MDVKLRAKMVQFSVRIPTDEADALEALAKAETKAKGVEVTRVDIIRTMVHEALQALNSPGKRTK